MYFCHRYTGDIPVKGEHKKQGNVTMRIYTKKGDRGDTTLSNEIRVSKSDDRIELLGTIDELNSALGLAKVLSIPPLYNQLELIQKQLIQIMSGISDSRNQEFHLEREAVLGLEEEIDQMEKELPRMKDFILYGSCEQSARLDMARAVARRAERRFRQVSLNYDTDERAMQYLNRLSDYLYVAARYADHIFSERSEAALRKLHAV